MKKIRCTWRNLLTNRYKKEVLNFYMGVEKHIHEFVIQFT